MSTAPRARGDESTAARPPADSILPLTNGRAGARRDVPRDAAKVPEELAAGYDQRSADDEAQHLRECLAKADARAIDGCMAIDAATAGRLFCLSERAWRRLDVTGQVPAPIHVGRSVRWRLMELDEWVRAGCPDRETWEAKRNG